MLRVQFILFALLFLVTSLTSETLRISQVQLENNLARVQFQSRSNHYCLLLRGDTVVNINEPVGFTTNGPSILETKNPADRGNRFYRLQEIRNSEPTDADGDGMDDLWENRHSLNPLDPSDAPTNLARYHAEISLSSTFTNPHPYLLVLPANSTNRTYATLQVTLSSSSTTHRVYFSHNNSGAVQFDPPSVLLTNSQSAEIRVYGLRGSHEENSTKVYVHLNGTNSPPRFTNQLTIVEGLQIEFEGNFEARLATNPDPSDHLRGTCNGRTRALIGEPDFDRIIRFSNPVTVRSFCSFTPVTVKRITASAPAGFVITLPDPILAQPVNLGPKCYFRGEESEPGEEPIPDFELSIGTNLFFGKAEIPPDGEGVDYLTPQEQANYNIDPLPQLNARIATLENALANLPPGQAAGPEGANLHVRIDVLKGLIGDYVCFSKRSVIEEEPSYKVPYKTIINQQISLGSNSPLLSYFSNFTQFACELVFFGYETDCMIGIVTGSLKPAP